MKAPKYQCHECGWYGDEAVTTPTGYSKEIRNGVWQTVEVTEQVSCPDCGGVFYENNIKVGDVGRFAI